MAIDMADMLTKLTNTIPTLQGEQAQSRAEWFAHQRELTQAVQAMTAMLDTQLHSMTAVLLRIETAINRQGEA